MLESETHSLEEAPLTRSNAPRLRAAIRIEIVSVVWMLAEGALSVFAGMRAGSHSLVAFGADSLIELISAAALLGALLSRRASIEHSTTERIASWIAACALAALSVFVAAVSIAGLVNKTSAQESTLGIALAVAAVLGMPVLGWRKRVWSQELNLPALRADAAESITCAYMGGAVLLGQLLTAIAGWWWIDSIATMALLVWLLPETWEAFREMRERSSEEASEL